MGVASCWRPLTVGELELLVEPGQGGLLKRECPPR